MPTDIFRPPASSSNSSFSSHAIQSYQFLIKSLCTNYLSALCSHTLPLFGATHHPPTIAVCKILQSKCLRVDNYPRRTTITRLHAALNVAPIRDFIYHFTDNFFGSCPPHPNPLVRSIGNYTLADLHRQYKKYIHKRPKHLFL